MSPMYDAGNGHHYFIDEPAGLNDGRVVIPVRWLEDEEQRVWFDAWEVKIDEMASHTSNQLTELIVLTGHVNDHGQRDNPY